MLCGAGCFAYTVNTDGSYNLTGACFINDPASYTKGTNRYTYRALPPSMVLLTWV